LYLEKLHLKNYRNYELLDAGFSPHFNILVGSNAQGKTNLIEAIYYLATGRAYRLARDSQLIKWETKFFRISGKILNKQGSLVLDILYGTDSQAGKEIKINGVKINKISGLLGNLTAVLFAPEDLNIIKGPPEERRKLLDNDISQVSPGYFLKTQQYNRILNQRNHLLKKLISRRIPDGELEIWSRQLLNISIEIIKKRILVLEKLAPLTRLMQRRLTGGLENLEIKYLLNKQAEIKKSDDIRDMLEEEMEKNIKEERKRGITLWGPHRDDLLFLLNGNDLKYFGSQGQHRTAVLAVKLAELEFFKSESGEFPVLLLDDVMSELDEYRRELLITTILDKNIQCFITTTDRQFLLPHGTDRIKEYKIKRGSLFET